MLVFESPYTLVNEYIFSPWNVLVSINRMGVIVDYTELSELGQEYSVVFLNLGVGDSNANIWESSTPVGTPFDITYYVTTFWAQKISC